MYGNNFQPINNASSNNINWIQGENSARAWIIAPNSTVLLMDSEENRFYIKSADASGMPTLRMFEYKEITSNPQPVAHDYRNEIDSIIARLEALENAKPERKRAKVEDEQ